MAMVEVDGSSLLMDSQPMMFGLVRVGSHLAMSLHLSSEPGELLQWLSAMMRAL